MDISSLAALATTQRAEEHRLSTLASDNVTWYSLVQKRFGIGCTKRGLSKDGVVLVRRCSSFSSLSDGSVASSRKKSPMTYGGSTWKEAYRSLSSTNRIPETRITSSTVFASPSRYRFSSSGNRTAFSRRRVKSVDDHLGVWCMVNHAENCRTKTVRRQRTGAVGNSMYNSDRRYLEVKLCLQNTKSGFGCISIPDTSSIRFVTVNEEEYFSHSGSYDEKADFPILNDGPWAPRILLRKKFNECDHTASSGKVMGINGIILDPFEFVVLSIHLSCPSDMVYETDVLSTLSSIQVPVGTHTGSQQFDATSSTSNTCGIAAAHFLPEDLIWEYYTQLPGGCLSLIDRSRLIPA